MTAAQAQKYSVRELAPSPGGMESFGHDISKQGAIIGSADYFGSFWSLTGGAPVGLLNAPSGTLTFHKINNLAEVAGWSDDGYGDSIPFLFRAGQLVALDYSGYYQGEAHCISDFFGDGYFGAVGRVYKTDYVPDGTDPKAPIRRNRAAAWNKAGKRILLPLLGNNSDAEFLPGNVATSVGAAMLASGSSSMVGKTHEQAVVWSVLNNSFVG